MSGPKHVQFCPVIRRAALKKDRISFFYAFGVNKCSQLGPVAKRLKTSHLKHVPSPISSSCVQKMAVYGDFRMSPLRSLTSVLILELDARRLNIEKVAGGLRDDSNKLKNL